MFLDILIIVGLNSLPGHSVPSVTPECGSKDTFVFLNPGIPYFCCFLQCEIKGSDSLHWRIENDVNKHLE